MRARTFGAIVFGMLLLTGCGTDSTQRLAYLEQAIKSGQEEVAQGKAIIEQLREQWIAARTAWADPNQSPPQLQELAAKMKEVEAQIIAATAKVTVKEADVEAYRKELEAAIAKGDAGPGEELELYGKGAGAVAPMLPPPWNLIVGAAATFAAAIGGALIKDKQAKAEIRAAEARAQAQMQKEDIYAQRRIDQANETAARMEAMRNEAQTAISGIVQSVSAVLNVLPTEDQVKEAAKAEVPWALPVLDQEAAKSILARAQVKVPEAAAAVQRELAKTKTEPA